MSYAIRVRTVISKVMSTAVTTALATGVAVLAGPPPAAYAQVSGTTYLAAALVGRNEIPAPGGAPVDDPNGRAIALVRVDGDRVSFGMSWTNVSAPAAAHIHTGARGSNGGVVVGLFTSALPDGLTAVVGSVTVSDPALLDDLVTNPRDFYVNLHTADFPDGAVRGQLSQITHPVDLNALVRGGPLASLLSGDQEVAAPGAIVGDPDGHATAFATAAGTRLSFTLNWSGIEAPSAGHIHRGAVGTAGPVVISLFAAGGALPTSISGIAGAVSGVDPALLRDIRFRPSRWYVNVHNGEFPDGAVRGQLFRAGGGYVPPRAAFIASVSSGRQIYACTGQPGGAFAFTQHNVRASLRGDITHTFVADVVGPPRWRAADHSAVTGALLRRSPNGADNIDELDLELTQIGARSGRLARAGEVLRLNTVGGVAPAGPCDPATQPFVAVPYRADYLFINE